MKHKSYSLFKNLIKASLPLLWRWLWRGLFLAISYQLPAISLYAGGDNFPVGARSAAMGNASVTLSDIWSVQHNQAGLGNIKSTTAGIYLENCYLLNTMNVGALAVAIPTSTGTFGVVASYFGNELYKDNKFGLAFGKSFGPRFSAGIQIDYMYTILADNYGSAGAFTFEGGVIANITDKLKAGVHVFNPIRSKLADYNDERVPTILRSGISYTFSEKVLVCAEVEKDIDYDAMLKAGIEYHIVQQFYLRAGISTNPTLNTFGFGLEIKNLKLDFSTSIHQTLGVSPQFGATYSF